MPQPSELWSSSWHVDPLHRFLQQKLSCTVPSISFRKTMFSPKHVMRILLLSVFSWLLTDNLPRMEHLQIRQLHVHPSSIASNTWLPYILRISPHSFVLTHIYAPRPLRNLLDPPSKRREMRLLLSWTFLFSSLGSVISQGIRTQILINAFRCRKFHVSHPSVWVHKIRKVWLARFRPLN